MGLGPSPWYTEGNMISITQSARALWEKAKEMTAEARREFFQGASTEDRHACRRLSVAETFERSTPQVDKRKEFLSPSGKYRLTVTPYVTGEKTWGYTQGLVYHVDTGDLISEVQYNYHDFPHAWVENHPKTGQDYLICEEDYQGQTVIELTTGKRVDYLPGPAAQGHDFCWSSIHPNPDGTLIAAHGCYWGGPYETIIVSFDDPMDLPWPQFTRDTSDVNWEGWIDNDSCKLGKEYYFSIKHQKRLSELTEEQQEESHDSDDDAEERFDTIIWTRPSNLEAVREYLKQYIEWRKKKNLKVNPHIATMCVKLFKKCSSEDQETLKNEMADLLSMVGIS